MEKRKRCAIINLLHFETCAIFTQNFLFKQRGCHQRIAFVGFTWNGFLLENTAGWYLLSKRGFFMYIFDCLKQPTNYYFTFRQWQNRSICGTKTSAKPRSSDKFPWIALHRRHTCFLTVTVPSPAFALFKWSKIGIFIWMTYARCFPGFHTFSKAENCNFNS